MKLYSAALILALAFANEESTDATTTTEENTPAAEEETKYSQEFQWSWDGVKTTGKGSGFKEDNKNAEGNTMGLTADKYKIWEDEEGNVWLKAWFDAGWKTEWENVNGWGHDKKYGGVWFAIQHPDTVVVAEDSTETTVTKWEVCTVGGTNQKYDAGTCGCAANIDSVNFVKQRGLKVFSDLDEAAADITAWSISQPTWKFRDGTKWIIGMKTEADRPFVPTTDRTSTLTIKNKESTKFCAGVYVNSSEINSTGFTWQGCTDITPDVPVPPPEKKETEEKDGALSGLYTSILAVTAMVAALNF